MLEINIQTLISDMLKAAEKPLGDYWQKVKPIAEQQFRQFGQNIQSIGEMKLKGKITEEQARLQLSIQKNSMQMVLLSYEGLGIIAVENAINAAIDVIRAVVNTSIGWRIL